MRGICLAAVGVVAALLLWTGGAAAGEGRPLDGREWMASTIGEKQAFLRGVGAMIATESAVQKGDPEAESRSAIPTLAKGLKGYTVESTVTALDTYYTTNKDQLDRHVIDVIWYELAVPNVRK